MQFQRSFAQGTRIVLGRTAYVSRWVLSMPTSGVLSGPEDRTLGTRSGQRVTRFTASQGILSRNERSSAALFGSGCVPETRIVAPTLSSHTIHHHWADRRWLSVANRRGNPNWTRTRVSLAVPPAGASAFRPRSGQNPPATDSSSSEISSTESKRVSRKRSCTRPLGFAIFSSTLAN